MRTTATAVRKIIEVDASVIAVDADMDPFIEAASAIVDDVCATALKADGSAAYGATRLELIERWLTAHFIAVRDPRTTQEKAGTVGSTFEGSAAMHLNFTRYGQQAMMLDTQGGLAALQSSTTKGARVKVGVTYLGNNDSTPETE